MIGKLFGAAVRVVNAPLDAVDELVFDEERKEGDNTSAEKRTVSAPLETLAQSLDKADKAFDKD